jgi:GNAT superfamily N-acetyltransferase
VTVRLETPSTQAHFEQWAAIMERVEGDVYDVDEVAHVIQGDEDSAWLLASLGDEAAGCGVGRPSSIAGSLYAMARVLPEHRGRGVGTRLYEALSEHAARLGLASLWGRIEDGDAASLRFAENRGFREVAREYEVVLDVADADLAGDLPEGVELVSLAERPELVQPVYDVDVEVGPDVPSHEEGHEPMTFERWHATYLEGPGAVPAACIVALAEDEVVGYTGLRRRGSVSPTAENLLTAVRRPWRRRGIATALKREQIARAREAGIEHIYTTNDETNVGMRGVNARLGYRPAPTRILVSGPAAKPPVREADRWRGSGEPGGSPSANRRRD